MSTLPLLFSLLIILFSGGCSREETNLQYLTIATADDPLSLDPRLVRDLSTVSVMHMLYEGLMSMNTKGIPEAGIASDVQISEDQKIYTFTLRPSQWSDGTPLTAQDFIETWQTILSPEFPAANAYQLYVIKGAKQIKEGKATTDTLGAHATAPNTLVVELEQLTSYFLELTACHFYFPVHPTMRTPSSNPLTTTIGNGPFEVHHWEQRNRFEVIKNPYYWNAETVHLAGIILKPLDEHTALQLFKSGSLDWAGSPLSAIPQDTIQSLKKQGILKIASGAGTHWFRFNTERNPFTNKKIRRAFSLALDRAAIVEHITQGNQQPAIGIIPPAFGITNQNYYPDHDTQAALALFDSGLEELNLTRDTLPIIKLLYAASDRNNKIAQAVQQQWKILFGIHISLESHEHKVALEKTRTGQYMISYGSWYADIQDPINFLELFKEKNTPANQTFWHSDKYTELLNQSLTENSQVNRLKIFNEAEKILIDNMPIAPLFYSSFNYLVNPRVHDVYLSPLGNLDFKKAYIHVEAENLDHGR